MKLKSLLLAPLAALALTSAAPAQDVLVQPQTAAEVVRPALWKLSDSDTTIYLFPAVAALPDNMNWNEGAVLAAFEGSNLLLTEVQDDPDQARMSKTFFELGTFAPGTTLEQSVGQEAFTRFDRLLRKQNLATGFFVRFKPWFAANIVGSICLQTANAGPMINPFSILIKLARTSKKEIRALETVESQLQRFDRIESKDQAAYFERSVDACDNADEEFQLITSYWAKGDLTAMDTFVRSDPIYEKVFPAMSSYRNPLWADAIAAQLKRPGQVFLIGSAANFVGPDSVFVELAKRGISAERVQ